MIFLDMACVVRERDCLFVCARVCGYLLSDVLVELHPGMFENVGECVVP